MLGPIAGTNLTELLGFKWATTLLALSILAFTVFLAYESWPWAYHESQEPPREEAVTGLLPDQALPSTPTRQPLHPPLRLPPVSASPMVASHRRLSRLDATHLRVLLTARESSASASPFLSQRESRAGGGPKRQDRAMSHE